MLSKKALGDLSKAFSLFGPVKLSNESIVINL